ncbi:MAG: hypothetical protein JXA13_08920 [Anaerolineales bacterium]|nr:hypothetical protein [Anaerolineales bacterium]
MKIKVQPTVPANHLEKQFISEYLKQYGLTRKTVTELPKHEYFQMMLDACKYASNKLAEVESRAKFVHAIRMENR